MVLVVLTLAIASILPACGRTGDLLGKQGGDVYQLPWPQEDGSYRLQKVQVESLEKPETLQGRFVRIMVEPYQQDGALHSASPVGRFARVKDGFAVPADYATLQAVAIHAHIERLAKIDLQTGIGAHIRWPITVGIQAKVLDYRTQKVQHNNAIFRRDLNALLILPYSHGEIPLALNAGVLAHEHFHLLFQEAVLNRYVEASPSSKPSAHRLCDWSAIAPPSDARTLSEGGQKPISRDRPEIPAETFNLFLLRAFNEGFADFWGWVYTGDPRFIAHSLPSELGTRRMDIQTNELASVDLLKGLMTRGGRVADESQIFNGAYLPGTLYARFLRELTLEVAEGDERNFKARLEVAKALIRALPALADQAVEAAKQKKYLSPNAILKPLLAEMATVSPKVCKSFERVAVAEAPGAAKPALCGTSTRVAGEAR